jgi:hypothetical protein
MRCHLANTSGACLAQDRTDFMMPRTPIEGTRTLCENMDEDQSSTCEMIYSESIAYSVTIFIQNVSGWRSG